MSRVAVKPEVLRWARERAGLSEHALRKHFPKYELWERGEAQPTLRQLEELAQKTYTPLGFFFLPEPPEEKLPIPDFRTVGDRVVGRPSPNLLDTLQLMQRRQQWMREYLIEEGQPPLSFIGSMTLKESPEAVAAAIRETLRLANNWAREYPAWTDALRGLRGAIENARILTVFNGVVGNNGHRKLDVNEFRGFILCDEYAPLIFINSADAKAAQMFTLVHEVAHLWLGRDGVFNLQELQPADNDVEIFCNRVAAEFLVPAQELNACWTDATREKAPLQALARRFKVSPLVVARRASDLGLLARNAFFAFYHEYMDEERRKAEGAAGGGNFYATQEVRIGRRFAEAVGRAAREGRLLYREAFRLTGLYGETFDRYFKTLELRP